MIWVSAPAVRPVVTSRVDSLPLALTVTVEPSLVVVTAKVGTWMASATSDVVMATWTVAPTLYCPVVSVNATVTGYDATPELASAIWPTVLTAPVAAEVPATAEPCEVEVVPP